VPDILTPIVERMLSLLPMHPEQLIWAPARAIRWHFPTVSLKTLPAASPFASQRCECDGYYEPNLTPGRPWILYRDDVAAGRVRFTMLHELGHHLIWDVDPQLLDLIDRIAGDQSDPIEVEERICHRFASTLLVSDKLLDHVLGDAEPDVSTVQALRQLSPASWQAVAVRVAQRMRAPGAVILLRSPGRVAFAATSPTLHAYWPAGSRVAPGGPLAHAFHRAHHNAPDIFAWEQTGQQHLWCSVRPVHQRLAVAVLSARPFGHLRHDPIPVPADAAAPWMGRDPDAGLDDPLPLSGLVGDALEDTMILARQPVASRQSPPIPAPPKPRVPVAGGLGEVRGLLRPGSLTVLAALPGHGASALALGLAVEMARDHGARVGLLSLEMSEPEVGLRLMAASASVDLQRLRTGSLQDGDWHRLLHSLGRLAELPITFLSTRLGPSLDDLVGGCLELKRRGRLDLLLVDYIQLLTADRDTPALFCDPHQALGRLKHLAIELGLAVIAVSRLGRRAEQRGDQQLELTDLPEHRAAGYVADLIGLLRRPHLANPWGDHGTAEVFLFRPGRLTTVLDLRFEGRYCRFTDGPIPTVDPTGPGGTRWGQRGPPHDRRAPQRGSELRHAAPLPTGGRK
jgi:DnaB-like helicase C terminal domain/IrrE N-terminal-like domain